MKKNGFTLTEMIAVIVIIGLIILVAIPVSQNLMANNKEDKYKLYVETVEKAIYTYGDITNTSVTTLKLIDLIKADYLQEFKENDVSVDNNTVITISLDSNRKLTFSSPTDGNENLRLKFIKSGEATCCTKKSCATC